MKGLIEAQMNLSAPKTVISELDWNFDNVPDNELAACCYWEYARESAFIPVSYTHLDVYKRQARMSVPQIILPLRFDRGEGRGEVSKNSRACRFFVNQISRH